MTEDFSTPKDLTGWSAKALEAWFVYHPIASSEQKRALTLVREEYGKKVGAAILQQCSTADILSALKELQHVIIKNCPDNEDRKFSLGNLDLMIRQIDAIGSYHALYMLRFSIIAPAIASIICPIAD